ncbi:MAG: alpha/beta hydrolase [Acidimicrobiia bacterium]|nr:alpha/beta hydrolase [Acidimicrobiia bacterium]
MPMKYDEFSMLEDNATEVGLAWSVPPTVRRESVDVGGGQRVSALVWGTGAPEIVLLHGGGQNAHTWDTVALALDRPLVAIDLPGHGHSDWRQDHDYSPVTSAPAVATAMRALAPDARLLVGMSLGGMTAMRIASEFPDLVRKLAIVDVTPGVNETKAEPIIAFLSGPERFESFDEILDRTVQFNPTRTVSSLRRGVLHNAKELDDGSWTWRYDPVRAWKEVERPAVAFVDLWDDVERIKAPTLLLRGGLSGVVSDDDVVEVKRRKPDAEVVTVDDAGHSIQGDQPVELARLLAAFLAS